MLNTLLDFIITFISGFWSKKERIQRKEKRTKFTTIDDIRSNQKVKLKGIAHPYQKRLKSPISKESCVHLQIKVKQDEGENEKTIINDRSNIPFVLQVGDIQCLIRPKGAVTNLITNNTLRSGIFHQPSIEFVNFMKLHQVSLKFLGVKKSLTLTEKIISKEQNLVVAGVGFWHTFEATGEKYFILQATPKNNLYISNKPTDLLNL